MCRVLNGFSGGSGHFSEAGGKKYHLKNFLYHQPGGQTAVATIRARESADGSLRYTVQIRIKKNGAQVYQESQTFTRKQAAQAWAKRRETGLSEPDLGIFVVPFATLMRPSINSDATKKETEWLYFDGGAPLLDYLDSWLPNPYKE